jgi:hypothetical protein
MAQTPRESPRLPISTGNEIDHRLISSSLFAAFSFNGTLLR